MKLKMATDHIHVKLEETATEVMPTTADAIYRASAMLNSILPPNFFGTTEILWENGKPVYFRKLERFKL